jgi:hypothetical protein
MPLKPSILKSDITTTHLISSSAKGILLSIAVYLPLHKALLMLNSHIANLFYDYRTNATPGN